MYLKYKIAIFHHFYCTDDGKGLVDSLGHIFHKDYRESIGELKLKAWNVSEIASWMNRERNKLGEDQREGSRLEGKCRSYFSVSLEETQNCRKSGNPYATISGINGEEVTLSHFSFAFLPDSGNYVWVRELSRPGCSICGDADVKKTFSDTNGCSNSNICEKWRRYPILKTDEKDPRKLAKNGQYDGKEMFVNIFNLLLCDILKNKGSCF